MAYQNTLYPADTRCAKIHYMSQIQSAPEYIFSHRNRVSLNIISRRYRVLPKYIVFRRYRVCLNTLYLEDTGFCQNTLYSANTGCAKKHYIPQIQGVEKYIIYRRYRVYQNTLYPKYTRCTRIHFIL